MRFVIPIISTIIIIGVTTGERVDLPCRLKSVQILQAVRLLVTGRPSRVSTGKVKKNKKKTLSKRVKKKNIETHKTKTGEGKINATKLVHKKKKKKDQVDVKSVRLF